MRTWSKENPQFVSELDLKRVVTDEDLAQSRRDMYRSARAWLEKRQPKGWRKPNMKRAKTFLCLKSLHNGLRRGLPHTHKRGLGRCHQSIDVAKRARPALSWPGPLSVVADYGSDILALVNFLQRCPRVKSNVEYIPGFNHGSWNGWKAAARLAGLWRHILVMIVHFLCRHGP